MPKLEGSNADVQNLVSLRRSASSVGGSGRGIVCKYERAIAKASFTMALSGHNMKEEFTNLKRMATQAKNTGANIETAKGPEAAEEVIVRHMKVLASCCEVILPRLIALRLEACLVHVRVVHEAIGGFTPQLLSDLSCRYACETMRPAVKKTLVDLVMMRVGVYQEGEKTPPSITDPRIFSDFHSHEDLVSGSAAATMVTFLEKYVLGNVIADFPSTREELVTTAKELFGIVNGYPSEYGASPRLSNFKDRLLGIIFIYGATPFECGSTIEHGEMITSDKSTDLYRCIISNDAAKGVLDSVWMTNVGEEAVWPAVEEVVRVLSDASSSPESVSASLVEASSKYTLWKESVRPNALAVALEKCVVAVLMARYDATNIATLDESKVDHTDPKLVALQNVVSKLTKSWSDIRITNMNCALNKVVRRTDSVEVLSKLRQLHEHIPTADPDGTYKSDRLAEFLDRLGKSLPRQGLMLNMNSDADIKAGVELKTFLCTYILEKWPHVSGTTESLVTNLNERVVIDNARQDDDGNNVFYAKEPVEKVSHLKCGLELLFACHSASKDYLALGDGPTARVAHEHGLEKIKNFMMTLDHMDQRCPKVVKPILAANTEIQALIAEGRKHCNSHGDVHCANGLQPLVGEIDNLKAMLIVGPRCTKVWKADIPEACSWEYLASNADGVLGQSFNRIKLIECIKSVNQACR